MDRCNFARPIRRVHASFHRQANSRRNCSRFVRTKQIRRPSVLVVALQFDHIPMVRWLHCRRIHPIRASALPFVRAELRTTIKPQRPETHWNQASRDDRSIDPNHEKRRNEVSDAVHPTEAAIRLEERSANRSIDAMCWNQCFDAKLAWTMEERST